MDYGWLTLASWEEKVALVDALAVAMCEATASYWRELDMTGTGEGEVR